MPIVSQQFRSKNLQNQGILTGRSKENPLGHKIIKHRQVIVTFPPVRLVGSNPYHVVEAQLEMRRFHVSEEHPPHQHVAFAKDLGGSLHLHLTHRGHGEGLELLGEVLAAPLSERSGTLHPAIVTTASPRQRKDDHPLLVEDVQVPPLHRLDMVVAGNRGPGSGSLLRPQRGSLLNLQHEPCGACIKRRLNYSLSTLNPQKLAKRLIRCHRPQSSCRHHASPVVRRCFQWVSSTVG